MKYDELLFVLSVLATFPTRGFSCLALARFSVDVGRIVNLKLPMTIAAKPVLSLPVDSTRLAKQEIKITDDNKKKRNQK